MSHCALSPPWLTRYSCFAACARSFVDVVGGGATQTVRLSDLPLTALIFLPDGALVGVGHGYDPLLFTRTASGWAYSGKLVGKKTAAKSHGAFASAKNMFQAQSRMGESAAAAAADGVASVHSNLVCGLQLFTGGVFGATRAEFTTSALDGKVGFWTRDEITAAMGAVAIS